MFNTTVQTNITFTPMTVNSSAYYGDTNLRFSAWNEEGSISAENMVTLTISDSLLPVLVTTLLDSMAYRIPREGKFNRGAMDRLRTGFENMQAALLTSLETAD